MAFQVTLDKQGTYVVDIYGVLVPVLADSHVCLWEQWQEAHDELGAMAEDYGDVLF